MENESVGVHEVHSRQEFSQLDARLNARRYVAIDLLKNKHNGFFSLGEKDPSLGVAQEAASCIGNGLWSNGPLSQVAWSFDIRDMEAVHEVFDKDGKTRLGLGYVDWGPGNNIPSVIPPLAQSSPYTAAPLRYIADTICGLGPSLMYRFPDGSLCDMHDAGYKILLELEKKQEQEQDGGSVALVGGDGGRVTGDGVAAVVQQHTGREGGRFIGEYVLTDGGIMTVKEAESLNLDAQGVSTMPHDLGPDYWNRLYSEWEKVWYGYDAPDVVGDKSHRMGAKEFLQNNNLNLHISQCMDDHVKLDIFFPTVGFSDKGRKGFWEPVIDRIGFLPAHSMRLERQDEYGFIHHAYRSDYFRTLGVKTALALSPESMKFTMFQAAMPQYLLHELRYIVSSNQKVSASKRPMWVVCPTFYPSLNKPYYPQPAWWSIFTSKAFDFSSTILYDKAKQRENKTSWGRIMYISLDYLDQVFADEGYQGNPDEQQKFIAELEQSMEDFLQHRENHGKYMRQWMWLGQDGKEHHNIEIVDIKDAVNDEARAGKEELELSTSPIFLALQVDPRLVGVPMVAASNGGTALREMQLLKQQQLNVHQRLYLQFLNAVLAFNQWDADGRVQFHIKQQTFTTLDNSKTGIVETIAGEKG